MTLTGSESYYSCLPPFWVPYLRKYSNY